MEPDGPGKPVLIGGKEAELINKIVGRYFADMQTDERPVGAPVAGTSSDAGRSDGQTDRRESGTIVIGRNI